MHPAAIARNTGQKIARPRFFPVNGPCLASPPSRKSLSAYSMPSAIEKRNRGQWLVMSDRCARQKKIQTITQRTPRGAEITETRRALAVAPRWCNFCAITGDWSSPLAGALTGLRGAEMAGFAAIARERCSFRTKTAPARRPFAWLRLSAGRATQFGPTRKGSERRGWIMRERRRCGTSAEHEDMCRTYGARSRCIAHPGLPACANF